MAASTIDAALKGRTDYKEIGRDADAIISAAPEAYRPVYRELAANDVLALVAAGGGGTETALDLLSHHTEVLIDAQSPSAEVILSSLRSLESRWAPEQMRNAALRAAESGEAFVLSKCASCEGNIQAVTSLNDARSIEAQLGQTANAVSELRALAR